MTAHRRITALAALSAALGLAAAPAVADDYDTRLRRLAEARLAALAAEPALLEAVRERNAGPDRSAAEIAALDADWRAQVGASSAPLIESVTTGPASRRLQEMRDASQGLLTEIILMDRQGLNVAVSDVTSDYWQGDEAKWTETYGGGGVHVSDIEFDESTQTYQAQISLPVADPETGRVAGAVTFGVNVEFLE
ncbi:MAG: hypothetical protein R6V44_14120 [Paracoccaceae bacterium]